MTVAQASGRQDLSLFKASDNKEGEEVKVLSAFIEEEGKLSAAGLYGKNN